MRKIFIIIILVFSITKIFAPDSFLKKKKHEENELINYLKDLERKEQALKDTLKKYEILKLEAYYLVNGWYVGYGHLVDSFCVITEVQAELFFEQDFAENFRYLDFVQDYKRRLLLAALAYNIGIAKVLRAFKEVNQMSDEEFVRLYLAFANFDGKWHKGLYQRRLAELKIFYSNETRLVR